MLEYIQILGEEIYRILFLLIPILVSVAMIVWLDRRVWGLVQKRKGPNVVGPFGLFQTLADALKYIFKEIIIPASANKAVFILAPIVTMTLALVAWVPSATYTEQNGLYQNLEGRAQECNKASYPIGEALEDWKIFNRILKKLSHQNKTSNFDELRKEVFKLIPNFHGINELPKQLETKKSFQKTNFFSEKILIRELDYYYTNSISRSSKTMSECRLIRQKIKKNGTNN